MENETHHSIAGGWLGTYYYAARTILPVRFEASFTRQTGGEAGGENNTERFGGSIVDDEGGHDYAAVSRGIQQGTFVRFVKTYTPADARGCSRWHMSARCRRTGATITGHWKIALTESRRARAPRNRRHMGCPAPSGRRSRRMPNRKPGQGASSLWQGCGNERFTVRYRRTPTRFFAGAVLVAGAGVAGADSVFVSVLASGLASALVSVVVAAGAGSESLLRFAVSPDGA